jgi:hypothetical protein
VRFFVPLHWRSRLALAAVVLAVTGLQIGLRDRSFFEGESGTQQGRRFA